ncbi:MAG: pseudouridine synthase [Muribaculaceae bacterium]|nr:pseudouridine synthase [Muribaculaceae bacterium]
MTNRLHRFNSNISSIPLPEKFTNPFDYTPHKLCVMAKEQTMQYIKSDEQLNSKIQEGKMLGVLVVKCEDNSIGFIAGFSGNIAHKNDYDYFVPPIYNLLDRNGAFAHAEKKLNRINAAILELENSQSYIGLKNQLEESIIVARQHIENLKREYESDRNRRAELRASRSLTDDELKELERQSQYQKAELKREKRRAHDRQQIICNEVLGYEEKIEQLKNERKQKSLQAQLDIFKSYIINNSLGEQKNLLEIFKDTPQGIPPAGAGDCAAPKMLQYAYIQSFSPLAMAEFWIGDSPKQEIRHSGAFYNACIGKCFPILSFMMRGLEIEDSTPQALPEQELEIIYEDNYLLAVNKHEGMLSVPGRLTYKSVYTEVMKKYPDITGPAIVHRLDMDTSGILLIAKDKATHKMMQRLFKDRSIKKRYVALLSSRIEQKEGIIELPLARDYINRPRQIVSHEEGKYALTYFKVIKYEGDNTLIEFEPHTGRTHQLRVHAAHHQGLAAPIVGDRLYGTKGEKRMHLHASRIEFTHPITGERIIINSPSPF